MAETFLKKDFASIVDSLLGDLSSGRGGRVALTDTTEGSVVRTLVEAFSRELAVSYAQLDQVYELGYLDTASGEALENVVALLGVSRRRGGYFQGEVTFSRAQPAAADIFIPAGTPVSGKELPPFETTAQAALLAGDTEVTVAVRSQTLPEKEPSPEELAPGVLQVMVRPLHGLETVTNRTQLVPSSADEGDEELRERARREVATSNLGTPAAIRFTLRALGLSQVDVQEPPDRPGRVEVVVGDPHFETLRKRSERALEEVRPAGIRVSLQGVSWLWVSVTATLELDKPYTPPERQAIEAELCRSLQAYVDGLGVNENVREAKVRNLLAGHPKVLTVYPGAEEPGARLLSAYVVEGKDTVREVTDKRRTLDGVVQVNAGERAGFHPEKTVAPFQLVLESPSPQVFVDVELQLNSRVEGAEEMLRAASPLQEYLSGLTKAGNTQLTFDELVANLPPALKGAFSSIRFTVVHERDGRVVLLDGSTGKDTLLSRERPKLRGVVVLGGTP